MRKLAITALVVISWIDLLAAQTLDQLAGVWTVVRIETVSADGKRTPAFGEAPLTQLILTPNGRFSQFFMRSDLPKFATGNRLTGTPEENSAVVKGSSVAFGTYTVGDQLVTLQVEGSTFPNWIGTQQRRPVLKLTADELVWTVPAASGGNSIETLWKRVR